MFDFSGKTVLVTGGGRGLGRVITRRFAECGATVFINYFHSPEAARELRDELTAAGAAVHLVRASVGRRTQVERMFEEIGRLTDGLDVLVNNAAGGALLPMAELDDQHWTRAWETNVRGTFWCSECAVPLMRARDGGAVVNLSSVGADHVMKDYVTVGTSKAAVESLTRYLAVEYAKDGVRVNTVSGGPLDSEVLGLFPESAELRRTAAAQAPMGRLGSERELADLVLTMASEATRWVTGQKICADGGLSLPILGASGRPPALPASGHDETAERPAEKPGENEDLGDEDAVAVVGMGLVCPGAGDPEEYWRLRLGGGVQFGEPGSRFDLSAFHSTDPGATDKTFARTAGFVDESLSSGRAEDGVADYGARWLRRALRQALSGVRRTDGERYSCFVGYGPECSQHLEEAVVGAALNDAVTERLREAGHGDLAAKLDALLQEALPLDAGGDRSVFLPHLVGKAAFGGELPDDARISMIDAACASSLYSIDLGLRELRSGACDVAVCGGAFALGPKIPVVFAKLGLSRSERVRPFDREADGVLFSDGAGLVVLKTLRRARADGDPILGVIRGFGGSSDGKGKSIGAPNDAGQRLAVRRAQEAAGVAGSTVEWVVAHGTGTPIGDRTEYLTLAETVGGERPCLITSNKSQIGHLGWAAGIVSFIEVMLAFRHERIPPQHEFEAFPDDFPEEAGLAVPREPRPWTARMDERIAAVSAFGVGGTNAHVIVSDRPPAAPPRSAAADNADDGEAADRIAVVGWSTDLPGTPSADEVAEWLRGRGPAPEPDFGASYPLPSLAEVRMPPQALRSMDRCQHMVLKCVARLRPGLEEFWGVARDAVGVFAAAPGPTRNSVAYSQRCFLDYIEGRVAADPELKGSRALGAELEAYRRQVEETIGPADKDMLTSFLPSIIAARAASINDFHGPTMTVLGGATAMWEAVRAARHHLRAGDLALALVAGVNGNTLPAFRSVLSSGRPSSGTEPAEGAFMLALTCEPVAVRHGLPVLAFLEDDPASASTVPGELHCVPAAGRSYLAADMARSLIEGVVSPADATHVLARDPATGRTEGLVVERHGVGAPVPGPTTDSTRRHVVRMTPLPPLTARPGPVGPREHTLVLTDGPEVAAAMPVDAAGSVLCVDGLDDAEIQRRLTALGHPVDHLLVVTRLGETIDPGTPDDGLRLLHDAAFLAMRHFHRRLRADGGSFRVLIMRGARGDVPHPYAGLLTGMARSAAWEFEDAAVTALAVETADVAAGMELLAAEAAEARPHPVVFHGGGRRLAPIAVECPAEAEPRPPLGSSPVIVASGGGRGVTAEVLVALAVRTRARIWVLGRTDLDAHPAWVFAGTDEEFAARCADVIRRWPQEGGGWPLAEAKRRVDRMRAARETRANLARMAEHSGEARVRYLTCDVTDDDAVRSAARLILDDADAIDLLIHGAMLNRSADIANKDLGEFRRIRDVKVLGYHRLKAMFGDRVTGAWCNFGSVIGFAGQPGELDYGSANDFLATAAEHANAGGAAREYTVHWPLWKSVGSAATPLIKNFLQRANSFSGMETGEGIRRFLDELSAPRSASTIIVLEPGQRDELAERVPGLFATAGGRPEAPARRRFPLLSPGARPEPAGGRLTVEREFDAETETHLKDHMVKGAPSLAGVLLLETAAEAALCLDPDRTVTAFTDVRFAAFVRARPARGAATYRVAAEVLGRDAAETTVAVRVLSDVRSPKGVLLRRDRVHFETVVHLRDGVPDAPEVPIPAPSSPTPVPADPHLIENPVLRLAGIFATNHDAIRYDGGSRAEFRVPVDEVPGDFADLAVPALLIDALFRVGPLSAATGDGVPLAVPATIRRIDLYTDRNDLRLAADHPRGVVLHCLGDAPFTDPEGARLVAVDPGGLVLAEITEISGVVLARIDVRTGRILLPEGALA